MTAVASLERPALDQGEDVQALPLLADPQAYQPCTFDYTSCINGWVTRWSEWRPQLGVHTLEPCSDPACGMPMPSAASRLPPGWRCSGTASPPSANMPCQILPSQKHCERWVAGLRSRSAAAQTCSRSKHTCDPCRQPPRALRTTLGRHWMACCKTPPRHRCRESPSCLP